MIKKKSDQRLITQKGRSYVHETRTFLQSIFSCTVYTTGTVSADQWRICGSHSGEYFSALNLQLCWGPARVKTSSQPVCPLEEKTAKSHNRRYKYHLTVSDLERSGDKNFHSYVGGMVQNLNVLVFKISSYCLWFVGDYRGGWGRYRYRWLNADFPSPGQPWVKLSRWSRY